MLTALIFLVALFPLANGVSCPACPQGGIWSEWTTTGKCPTTCGACSFLSYTRTCLSDELKNCPCVGSQNITQPCGTQACNYPRANGLTPPCCNGLVPKIINNWYYCVNSTQPEPTPPCCPTGGIWGDWTDWVATDGKAEWTRTRKCLSGGFNCACVGEHEQVKNDCPCPLMTRMKASSNPCSSITSKTLFDFRDPVFFPSTCTTRVALEATNFLHTFYTLNETIGKWECTTGYVDESGICKTTQFQTGSGDTSGEFFIFNFKCDVKTKTWNGWFQGVTMKGVTQIGQFFTPA